ncbi:MAG: histidine phosphatase family protein [Dehalococcoidales bacterium]|nr:histidine phosphatase family protein [Dehalococcoidales bacterium]
MARLFLVRHGITEFNSSRRFMGYSDIDLSVSGFKQAERLCGRLAGEKFDAVYSSDLKRALSTAEIITSDNNVDIIECSELREMNYGYLEGLKFEEINQRYPEVAKSISGFNFRTMVFPGGESFMEFIERTRKFLDRLKKYKSSQTILVVSHNGALRVLICCLLKLDFEYWRQFRIDNASLSILQTHDRGVIINLLNDTSYL